MLHDVTKNLFPGGLHWRSDKLQQFLTIPVYDLGIAPTLAVTCSEVPGIDETWCLLLLSGIIIRLLRVLALVVFGVASILVGHLCAVLKVCFMNRRAGVVAAEECPQRLWRYLSRV